MKQQFIVALLTIFVISGCDEQQTSQVPENIKSEIIKAAPEVAEVEAIKTEKAPVIQETKEKVVEAVVTEVQKTALSGEQVYQKFCVNCHRAGVANAPKFGDAAAWAPRIAKGTDVLYTSAKKGVPGTAMMAKGACSVCSDEELETAVDYMVSGSK